jgi:hypothetical protein
MRDAITGGATRTRIKTMAGTRNWVAFGTATLIGICFGSLFAGAVLFVANAKPSIGTPDGRHVAPAAFNAGVTR